MSSKTFLNQKELSKRWKLSHRTLERWRWLGTGPQCHKIGGRVVYNLNDIEDWENNRILSITGERAPEWPDNIIADRHPVSGKWVLQYLTDKQAEICRRNLYAAGETHDQ